MRFWITTCLLLSSMSNVFAVRHSGDKFQDAFYENEMYQVAKYDRVFVHWVGSDLVLRQRGETDIDRAGAGVIKYTDAEVEKLLNWDVAVMFWDNDYSTPHATRFLDSYNIRVLDQPGYYYIHKVVMNTIAPYSFNQIFATFALGDGGFSKPPFSLCSHGDNPHVLAQSGQPNMCCTDAGNDWSCTHEPGNVNFYPINCEFEINDCSDPLQDCQSAQQNCVYMIPAKTEDQCAEIGGRCWEAESSKWMVTGAKFSGAAETTPFVTVDAGSQLQYKFEIDKNFELGMYKSIWRISVEGGASYSAPSPSCPNSADWCTNSPNNEFVNCEGVPGWWCEDGTHKGLNPCPGYDSPANSNWATDAVCNPSLQLAIGRGYGFGDIGLKETIMSHYWTEPDMFFEYDFEMEWEDRNILAFRVKNLQPSIIRYQVHFVKLEKISDF